MKGYGATAGGYSPLSEWEVVELMERLTTIRRLPYGQRGAARRATAAEYGVCDRTLLRWEHKSVEKVRVGPYEALFAYGTKRGKRPYQVTPWEKAA